MTVKKFSILNVNISAIDLNDACALVNDAVSKKRKAYICTCPVSTIMGCKKDKSALASVNGADLAAPDGMPVVWIGTRY